MTLYGREALRDAAAAGKTVAVVFLLGQRVSVEGADGRTAIMEAAERNRTEVLELIMADARTSRRLRLLPP